MVLTLWLLKTVAFFEIENCQLMPGGDKITTLHWVTGAECFLKLVVWFYFTLPWTAVTVTYWNKRWKKWEIRDRKFKKKKVQDLKVLISTGIRPNKTQAQITGLCCTVKILGVATKKIWITNRFNDYEYYIQTVLYKLSLLQDSNSWKHHKHLHKWVQPIFFSCDGGVHRDRQICNLTSQSGVFYSLKKTLKYKSTHENISLQHNSLLSPDASQ